MLKYRSDIDGLRAVAVIPVILFHLQSGFPGGYAGVDVFFVISGYLITSLILKAQEEKTFSLIEFWERRIRRLFPAFFVMLVATLIFGYVYFLPNDYIMLTHAAFAQLCALGNVYFFLSTGYFSPAAEFTPLLHTWSLAVEEQFYFLLPLLLILLKPFGKKKLRRVLLIGCSASFLLCCWAVHYDPHITFYLLPTRAWEMLLGGLLVLYRIPLPQSKAVREGLAAVAMMGLFITYFAFSASTPFPSVYALLPCLSTAILLHVHKDTLTSVGKLLSWKPFLVVGAMSYSLYLWHWPVLCFFKYARLNEELSAVDKLGYLIAVFVLGYLSWRFIEGPFRRQHSKIRRVHIFSYAGGLSSVLLAFCVFVHIEDGLRGRLPSEAAKFHKKANGHYIHGDRVSLEDVKAHKLPLLGGSCSDDMTPSFILWGDSHAAAVSSMLHRYSERLGICGVASYAPECLPVGGVYIPAVGEELLERNAATLEYILERGVTNVILVARWSVYAEDKGAEYIDYLLSPANGQVTSSEESFEIFKSKVKQHVQTLTDAGVRVWIMKQIPTQEFHVPQIFGSALLLGKEKLVKALHLNDHRARNVLTNNFLDELAGPMVTVLDPLVHFRDGYDRTLIASEGISLYRDEDHLSEHGASQLIPLFEPLFSSL